MRKNDLQTIKDGVTLVVIASIFLIFVVLTIDWLL